MWKSPLASPSETSCSSAKNASSAAAAGAAPLRDPLWNQLAALPVLTFQAMEGRTGELAATVAEGVVESVQQHALGELSDSVVLALCADGTADFGKRLTKALESNRSAASLRAEFRGDIDLLATQAMASAGVGLGPAGPAAAAAAATAAPAPSHLELASGPAEPATSTIEMWWSMLPELLMQGVDTQVRDRARRRRPSLPAFALPPDPPFAPNQVLHALYDVNGTALALVDAAFAVGDELVQRKRLPSLGGVREQGSKLLSQILTLSGAWSPEAPALVSAVLEQEVLAPLNSTGAEAMRSLRLLTGEDVGAAMATLLENAPGNKVDALQTMLRAIVRLYRNAFVELIGDARAATAPWKHNLTLAATEIVDAIHDAPPKLWKKLQAEVRDASRTGRLTRAASHAQLHRSPRSPTALTPLLLPLQVGADSDLQTLIAASMDANTSRALLAGVRRAVAPLQKASDEFAAQLRSALVEAIDGSLQVCGRPPSADPPALPYLNPFLSHASPPSLQNVLSELDRALPAAGGGGIGAEKTQTARALSQGRVQQQQQEMSSVYAPSDLFAKWEAVTRRGFDAVHHALLRPANSTTDVLEVRDNFLRGVRASMAALTSSAMARLRESAVALRKTYTTGVRHMAALLTKELLLGTRASLVEAGVCARAKGKRPAAKGA